MDTIEELTRVLQARRTAEPESSYVAGLYRRGLNRILEKVGEEAVEVILAARDTESSGDRAPLVHEVADLWFHTLVMLVHLDIDPAEVLTELDRRSGTSGLVEKRRREDAAGSEDSGVGP